MLTETILCEKMKKMNRSQKPNKKNPQGLSSTTLLRMNFSLLLIVLLQCAVLSRAASLAGKCDSLCQFDSDTETGCTGTCDRHQCCVWCACSIACLAHARRVVKKNSNFLRATVLGRAPNSGPLIFWPKASQECLDGALNRCALTG